MKNVYVKVDSRNRISLTKITGKLAPIYRAYTDNNRIILEPMGENQIPQEEAWLFDPKNKAILEKIKKSLQQDATIDLGSFKKYLPKKN